MRHRRALIVFSLFLFPVLFFPAQMFAAENDCTCFCATKSGAQKLDGKMTKDKCEESCEANGDSLAVCAKTARQFPSNNALCFDDKACAEQNGEKAKQQAPECPTGWSYCFPKPEANKLKLSTRIGQLEAVGDLGEYVSGVYQWMLSIAGFLAVVMTLIGGLQYVIGAASSEQVSKGKERIKNGVIGMVLLFCVVLILQTINPQLLKLEIPRPSKLRIINLAGNACEKLEEQGYELKLEEGAKKECGGSAEVVKGPKGTQVADGLTCQYTKCEKGACVATGTNAAGVCTECRQVTSSEGNPNSPGKPTPQVCTSLTVEKRNDNGDLQTASYCTFGLGNNFAGYQTSADVNIEDSTCMEAVVDCGQIEDCENYDDIDMYYYDDDELVQEDIYDAARTYFGFFCKSDPCGVAKKSNGEISECDWDEDKDCDNVD